MTSREAGHRAGKARGPGCAAWPLCSGALLSAEMAPGVWQRTEGGQLQGVSLWPPEGHGACHSPSELRADFLDATQVSWAGSPGALGQPPWPGSPQSVSLGWQWWGGEVPACRPVLGVWGAGGGQWFLHLSGETASLRALDLRACQAVGVLRPFLCPATPSPRPACMHWSALETTRLRAPAPPGRDHRGLMGPLCPPHRDNSTVGGGQGGSHMSLGPQDREATPPLHHLLLAPFAPRGLLVRGIF